MRSFRSGVRNPGAAALLFLPYYYLHLIRGFASWAAGLPGLVELGPIFVGCWLVWFLGLRDSAETRDVTWTVGSTCAGPARHIGCSGTHTDTWIGCPGGTRGDSRTVGPTHTGLRLDGGGPTQTRWQWWDPLVHVDGSARRHVETNLLYKWRVQFMTKTCIVL